MREQAAFALGQIRDRAAVEALVIAIKDPAADVREQVAFALGQLRDPRAIDALTTALKDRERGRPPEGGVRARPARSVRPSAGQAASTPGCRSASPAGGSASFLAEDEGFMSPLAVFFRTLSRSSAICLGVGFAIVNPSLEWSPGARADAADADDRRHGAEEPERGAPSTD